MLLHSHWSIYKKLLLQTSECSLHYSETEFYCDNLLKTASVMEISHLFCWIVHKSDRQALTESEKPAPGQKTVRSDNSLSVANNYAPV